ncbi:hypothetical protein INS49_015443 [Diaporthe citri]|uniref:uncharacterized protein n=1 Tax=Diaporthe citri TaxID=83186 RepID=UPI001C8225AB|nr:uncharacterized protein INS49_015443 [Diaporthe citri]KAG6356058.1 hypothetical protein INS49_015443 [Diaporthe citri]
MNSTVSTQQLVIIAKPGPDQPYCQLATAFQNCLCLQSILHPCLNTLRAFSDERYRVGILQELAFAAENQPTHADLMLPADRYYQASEQKDADYRFPYITATLISSMACCVGQEHNCYRCSLEAPFHTVRNPFRAAHDPLYKDCSMPGDITVGVIDITDLRKLRYCFLNMPIWCVKCGLRSYHPDSKTIIDTYGGDLPEWEMADYTPSDGEPISYRIDFDSNGQLGPMREGPDVGALEMLRAYPLIDVATLANCWPAAAWKLPEQPTADSNHVSVYLGAPKCGSKSLGELAQNKILDAVLLGLLDDLELLDYPMLIRGFQKSFLAICSARADELAASEHQGIIAAMLARLMDGANHVDLYPFRQLPLSTIREILCSDRLKDMKILNLSGLFAECPEEIWTTLDAIPHQPEVVYLLSPPSVDRTAERAVIKRTVPHYIAGGRCKFWDRVGSKRIIMSASISTALMSYASSHRGSNFQSNPQWERTYLNYLRELVRGDTMRLRLWPWMWW